MLLALAGVSAGAQELDEMRSAGTIRLSELRESSGERMVRLLFGRLAAFPYATHPDRSEFSWTRPEVDLWFYTPAHRTERPGICRAEWLIVTFRSVPGGEMRDPMMQPRGFRLRPIFLIENREEGDRSAYESRRSPEELEAACNRLDPRGRSIPAEDISQLLTALWLTDALGDGARTGRAIAPLDCRAIDPQSEPPADEAACLQRLTSVGRAGILWVQSCYSRRPAPAGCVRIMTLSWWIEFDLNSGYMARRVVITGREQSDEAF